MNVKIPIGSELSSEISFNLNLFPDWLQEIIKKHSNSYKTPPEVWAIAFLSGIATASGKRFRLINGNHSNYPQLWIMVVGSSGTGKSDPLKIAFKELEKNNEESYLKFQSEFQQWEADGKLGPTPHWKQHLINDTTPEALFSVLKHANNGLTLYRDELSGWFSDFGRYSKSGEVGHYLSIFDNANISINRKMENPQLITNPLLNIVGTIQPSVLRKVLSQNNAEQSGFAQRFLYLYPDFPIRKYQHITPSDNGLLYYNIVINDIFKMNEVTTDLYLSNEAETLYESYYNEIEGARGESDDYWSAVYSKAQIQVLRLALTVKISRYGEVKGTKFNYVEAEDMECAIMMMRYFIQSLEKLKEESRDPKRSNKELIKEIFEVNPRASQSDVCRVLGITQQYVSKVVRLLGVNSLKHAQGNGLSDVQVYNQVVNE